MRRRTRRVRICAHRQTQTDTDIHRHARTYTSHPDIHRLTQTSYADMHRHTWTYTDIHRRTQACTDVHRRAQTHRHTQTYTAIHGYTWSYMEDAQAYTDMHRHTQTRTDMHRHTQTYIDMHRHTQTHNSGSIFKCCISPQTPNFRISISKVAVGWALWLQYVHSLYTSESGLHIGQRKSPHLACCSRPHCLESGLEAPERKASKLLLAWGGMSSAVPGPSAMGGWFFYFEGFSLQGSGLILGGRRSSNSCSRKAARSWRG